jgi:DNA-binding CsgD family transcriptional regulator
MKKLIDYALFTRFLDSYLHHGFKNIDTTNPLVVELEEKMTANKQFIIVGDLIQVNVFYASKGYYDFFGQIPAESYPLAVFENGRPDIKERFSVARSKLFSIAHDMFIKQSGKRLLSSNFTIKNCNGCYIDLMIQCYMVYSEIPYRSVFVIMVHTDITNITQHKHGFHFYEGQDVSFFRFPDKQLLMTGNVFTNREYEIIKCIADGLDSQQIAEKLFLSIHTVNTHRKNMLNKTGSRTTLELVIELKKRGVI